MHDSSDNHRKYKSAKEIAAIAGCHPRTILRAAKAGDIPFYRVPGTNRLRFIETEVEAAMKSAGGGQ